MSAPVTVWTDQPDIDPTLTYDDANTSYDDSTIFYDDFDPSDFEPRPASWTDVT